MPLYEYQCESCDHRFELIRKFSDPPVEICPKCGGPVRKLVSSPAFQFKGSGWYVTDYAKKPDASGSDGKSTAGGDAGKDKATSASKETGAKETSTKDSSKESTPSNAPASSSGPAKD
jgi:putative FmdB family regulatory protein